MERFLFPMSPKSSASVMATGASPLSSRVLKKGDRLLCPRPQVIGATWRGGRGQSGLSPFFSTLLTLETNFGGPNYGVECDSSARPAAVSDRGYFDHRGREPGREDSAYRIRR